MHALIESSTKLIVFGHLEVAGFVFFGSSLGILHRIMDEVGLELNQEEAAPITPFLKSPHTPAFLMMKDQKPYSMFKPGSQKTRQRALPKYLALDLTRLHNLDGKLRMLLLSYIFCYLMIAVSSCNLQCPRPVGAFYSW